MRLTVACLLAAACSSNAPIVGDMAIITGDMGGFVPPAGTTQTPFLSTDPGTRNYAAADQVLVNGKDYLAVIETDQGRIVLDLFETQTPITVNSFVFLALHHYFDGLAFHRVIASLAQAGDPNTLSTNMANWGTGGPGYGFGLEIVPSLNYDGAGTVGMARTSNPNSNGSQFFITFAARHDLDGMYTIFARVTEGLDVLPKLVAGEPPATPTRMQRVYIVER